MDAGTPSGPHRSRAGAPKLRVGELRIKSYYWRVTLPPVRLLALLVVPAVVGSACDIPVPPPVPSAEVGPDPAGEPGWKITRRYSAHHALIVEVECADRERALAIAREIVTPVTDTYFEALVYVRPPGSATTRRVQWTRSDGEFRVMDF